MATTTSNDTPDSPRSADPTPRSAPLGVEFGWKVHAALQDWTRSVDQKASIVLAFVVALGALAGHEALEASGALHDAAGAKLWIVRAMGAAFAISALCAVAVVLPRLRRRKTKQEAPQGLIYFGHLRHHDAAAIEERLRVLDDDAQLSQLARQLKATAAIAWRKHVCLQCAVTALVLAAVLFGVARLVM